MQKEAIVVILDVGRSMGEEQNKGQLQGALNAVRLLVHDKLTEKPGNVLMSLVFMGTKASSNQLHGNKDEDGNVCSGYEHISLIYDIAPPTFELINFVSEAKEQDLLDGVGGSSGDFIDALVIAFDVLNVRAKGSGYSKKIFLFTDAGSPTDFQLLEPIISNFSSVECSLNIIGIGFGDENLSEERDRIQECIEDDNVDITKLCSIAQDEGRKTGISDVKSSNIAILRYIAHRIPLGAIFTLQQATSMLRFVSAPKVLTRTTFRGLFEIAPGLSIPVHAYKKCHCVTLPTLSKVIVADDNPDGKKQYKSVEKKMVYRLQNDLSVEVDSERTIRGFKYGRSIIPESSIDAEVLKPKTERCLVLIGFTDAYKVPRQYFIGEPDVVFAAPSDKYAYSALSAFIIAMAELDKYAICRYISRKSAQPAIVALIPHIGKNGNSMWMITLPFAEDLRNYPFAPLAPSDPRTRKAFCPNSEQSLAARELIQALDIDEHLSLKETRNPMLQVFYDAVNYKAVHPDVPIPPPDPSIIAPFTPDPNVFGNASEELRRFKELFPTERNKALEKALSEKAFWSGLIDDDTRDINLDSYMKRDGSEDDGDLPDSKKPRQIESAELELYTSVSEVGSVTPASDFAQMLKRRDGDYVLIAMKQLWDRTLRFVEDSLGSQYYEKAAGCVRALREGCVQEDEPKVFNDFLGSLRSAYEYGSRSEFWSIIVRNKLNPISNEESLYSSVSKTQSDHYFDELKNDVPSIQDAPSPPDSHDSIIDDLLDMAE